MQLPLKILGDLPGFKTATAVLDGCTVIDLGVSSALCGGLKHVTGNAEEVTCPECIEEMAQQTEAVLHVLHDPHETASLFAGGPGTAPTMCGLYVRREQIPFGGHRVNCPTCLELR